MLKEFHASDIVNADIKPSNILISKSGDVKFIDFGAATLLKMGENTWKLIGHMEQLDTGHQKKIKTIYLENVQIFIAELQSLSSVWKYLVFRRNFQKGPRHVGTP